MLTGREIDRDDALRLLCERMRVVFHDCRDCVGGAHGIECRNLETSKGRREVHRDPNTLQRCGLKTRSAGLISSNTRRIARRSAIDAAYARDECVADFL